MAPAGRGVRPRRWAWPPPPALLLLPLLLPLLRTGCWSRIRTPPPRCGAAGRGSRGSVQPPGTGSAPGAALSRLSQAGGDAAPRRGCPAVGRRLRVQQGGERARTGCRAWGSWERLSPRLKAGRHTGARPKRSTHRVCPFPVCWCRPRCRAAGGTAQRRCRRSSLQPAPRAGPPTAPPRLPAPPAACWAPRRRPRRRSSTSGRANVRAALEVGTRRKAVSPQSTQRTQRSVSFTRADHRLGATPAHGRGQQGRTLPPPGG